MLEILMKSASVNMALVAFALFSASSFQTQAMDRWAALSQIESGNNDFAVGRLGELSRYQIKPAVWRQYAPPKASFENPQDALAIAQQAMKERCDAFEQEYQRSPTDLEFYILWNAPAQLGHPSKSVRLRAERFCNLLKRP